MRTYLYALILLLFVLFQSCANKQEKAKTSKVENMQAPTSLKVTKVILAQPDYSITLPGELLPYEQVNIYPKIKGFVKRIYVDRGANVSKGQLLAVLEAPEIGARYAASQSSSNMAYQKYLFSKQAYQRLKEASKKNGAVAQIELERAYAQMQGDSASYKSTNAESAASGQIADYLRITAPFSGIITGRFISEGALVGDNAGKNEPLFQLAQQNNLRLTVGIPEKEARSLQAGTKASFTVVDLPDKTFTATLSRNSEALDISSRSLIAEFDVANPASILSAGQYAKVNIGLKRAYPTLWVPATSVVQTQSGIFVIKLQDARAVRIPVLIGGSKDLLLEVFGDLKEGDLIVNKGSEEIKEGIGIKGVL